jgi:DNA-binding MarR family transcriptional regulator
MTDTERERLAEQVLSTLLLGMRAVGSEMQARGDRTLGFQQSVAMRMIRDHQGTHLTALADRMGMTISATSKLVDKLVGCGLVQGGVAAKDRRRLILTLTEQGEATLNSLDLAAVGYMADVLSGLSPTERGVVRLAMGILAAALTRDRSARPALADCPPSGGCGLPV